MKQTVQVWARVGAYVEVDTAKFIADPENALREGIKAGRIKPSGESYIPEATVQDELMYRGISLDNIDGLHPLIENDESIETNF